MDNLFILFILFYFAVLITGNPSVAFAFGHLVDKGYLIVVNQMILWDLLLQPSPSPVWFLRNIDPIFLTFHPVVK